MKDAPQNTSVNTSNASRRTALHRKPYVAVAPMMDWTDRHCRYFHRLLSPNAVLFTEMVTTGALIYGDRDRFLRFSPQEHPIVLQLGGSDPKDLAISAKMAEDFGYDEINLNCGCPSDRVQKGAFGACLMGEADLVAECVASMMAAVNLPVTVKCRIGIDDSDDLPFLRNFITKVSAAGCDTFTIHARKAWLKGLSPKENREIPPLRYDIAEAIKQERPDLNIILNGGIQTIEQVQNALTRFDGVMLGREAYQNPWILAQMAETLDGIPLPEKADIARAMIPYIQHQQANHGASLNNVTRHMLGLYNGQRGAKLWRQTLGGEACLTNDTALIETALQKMAQNIGLAA